MIDMLYHIVHHNLQYGDLLVYYTNIFGYIKKKSKADFCSGRVMRYGMTTWENDDDLIYKFKNLHQFNDQIWFVITVLPHITLIYLGSPPRAYQSICTVYLDPQFMMGSWQ